MPTIVSFEIPANNIERAKKFYTNLFGWKIEKYFGPTPIEYWNITTTDKKSEKGIDGGLVYKQDSHQSIAILIGVPSIDEHTVKVEKFGGKVVVPKTSVPGVGYFAVCLDTENNAFQLWEVNKNAN